MRKLAAQLEPEGPDREMSLERLDDGRVRAVIDGVERVCEVKRLAGGGFWLWADGRSYVVDVDPSPTKDGRLVVEVGGQRINVRLYDPRLERLARQAARPKSPAGAEDVRASMPGRVVRVLVKVGDHVRAAQGLVVVEAMKMENELRAVRDGRVRTVHVAEGQAVEAQEPLVTLE